MLVRRVTVLSSLLLALAVAVPVAASAPAQAAGGSAYAPIDRPGPRLSVDPAKLRASLACHGNPRSGGEPVLLNPATSVTPDQDYSWTYEKAFTAQQRYWCAVTMPFHTFGDIQTAGQYLVHAIRSMHARTGRRIGILGHSQGGMSMRWALRFWPDTRPMVDDVIGMAASNHGTTALPVCGKLGVTTCTPAVWQQQADARFIKALNSRAETFAGISYTEIYTHTDEVVVPNSTAASSSSSLHTGNGRITNVATQDVCPTDLDEHLLVGTVDPTTYDLVMDALTHRGPASPARIGTTSCSKLSMPYVDPANLDTYLQPLSALPSLLSTSLPMVTFSGAPMLKAEPPLRCYTLRVCLHRSR
ncbi:hypothetical protein GCM10028801_44330 [Nocardioides maradonensis]